MPHNPTAEPPPVPVLLRWCLHLLVAGLLLLAALRVVVGHGHSAAGVVVMAVVVGGVYAVGNRLSVVSRSRVAAGLWLAVLLACWLGLLFLTPDAIYLAFPWFFLLLHLLPRRAGLVAVGFTTVAAIGGFGWHQETFTAAMAIGPILGAGVVIATVWGYQALQEESEQRRRLIEQLRQTRAELAAAERESGMLAERERLAREIHDTLAQGLSSIQLLLRAAGRSLQPGSTREPGTSQEPGTTREPGTSADVERAATLVEQARHTAQDNLTEARRFVQALAPSALHDSSLAPALRRLCETTSQRAGIPITFHQEGAPSSLPAPVEVALLRIAQSALGNVIQHAQATRTRVTLTGMDTAVSLDVVDDGVGFDPANVLGFDTADGAGFDPANVLGAAAGSEGGFGLISMRSRAVELGGTMTVESEPGQGTAVAVSIDLANPRRGQSS